MSQAADEAIKAFTAKAGHSDTTVHEIVRNAVLHERVEHKQHETVQTAVDREVHQNHYHTSVQPITDLQVLPEEHRHNIVAVEHRKFEHGDQKEIDERLAKEAAQFKDERIISPTKHTHSVGPVIAGEHIHHHVFETIQPVVQRETIQATVIHTTVPIHEVHINAAKIHTTSALPAVTMADFQKQGGVLTGREERMDGFEGEPKSVGGPFTGMTKDKFTSSNKHSHTGSTGSTSGKPTLKEKLDPRIDSDRDGKAGAMD